ARPPAKVQMRDVPPGSETIGMLTPSMKARSTRSSNSREVALRDRPQPGSAPAKTLSAARHTAKEAGLAPPNQRERPGRSAVATDTRRLDQSISTTRQLRPASSRIRGLPSRDGARASGWTEPNSLAPSTTDM